jgi:hypothetical protein
VFGALPAIGFLETLTSEAKNEFVAVGYGQQGTPAVPRDRYPFRASG